MAKIKTAEDLQRFYFESMGEQLLKFHAQCMTVKGSPDELLEKFVTDRDAYLAALSAPVSALKEFSNAVGIDLTGLRAAQDIRSHVSDAIDRLVEALDNGQSIDEVETSRASFEEEEEELDQPAAAETISVEELWEESARIALPVLHLKARKTKNTSQAPVAVWNSSLSSGWKSGAWMRVDLRHHPNPKVQANGVLTVHIDHPRGPGKAIFEKSRKLQVEKGEKPLYGAREQDYPENSVLAVKASKKVRTAIEESPHAMAEYEQAWWEEVHPRDHLSDTAVYAQLGGWPITWPEDAADEQLRKHLVLRTYRDSEPWIEVFRSGRKFEVFERIT